MQTRLYIGDVPLNIKEKSLNKFLSKQVSITQLEIKIKKDPHGNPVSTFAYANLEAIQHLNEALAVLRNTKFKGGFLKIEVAKESFLDRLKREREEIAKKQSYQDQGTKATDDIVKLDVHIPKSITSQSINDAANISSDSDSSSDNQEDNIPQIKKIKEELEFKKSNWGKCVLSKDLRFDGKQNSFSFSEMFSNNSASVEEPFNKSTSSARKKSKMSTASVLNLKELHALECVDLSRNVQTAKLDLTENLPKTKLLPEPTSEHMQDGDFKIEQNKTRSSFFQYPSSEMLQEAEDWLSEARCDPEGDYEAWRDIKCEIKQALRTHLVANLGKGRTKSKIKNSSKKNEEKDDKLEEECREYMGMEDGDNYEGNRYSQFLQDFEFD